MFQFWDRLRMLSSASLIKSCTKCVEQLSEDSEMVNGSKADGEELQNLKVYQTGDE